MNFEIKQIEDVTVFKLNEKKLDTNNSSLVKGEFTLLLKVEGVTRLIIDLTEVENCDSSGLSALLVANRLMNANEGEMKIANLSEKVISLMKITQLDRVLSVCSSVEDALEELKEN
jgi:anti-sigma B factor antagonist